MNKLSLQSYFKIQSPESKSGKVIKGAISEILVVAKKRSKKKAKKLVVLDVGCGSGEYSFEIEKYVKKVYATEPYKPKYLEALKDKKNKKSKVIFYNKLVEDLKISQKFDLVMSLTTIEHMPQAEKSFAAIFKMLKKGGLIYLTCPNKLWLMEQHYSLPFLSWLPLPMANMYVRLTGRGNSYADSAYSRSYFGMQKLFNKFPCRYEFILPKDLNNPYIGCGPNPIGYNFIKNLGMELIRLNSIFWMISKGFIMVITKK